MSAGDNGEMITSIDQAAHALVDAAATRIPIDSLPTDLRPETVADGYAIQRAAHRLAGAQLGPWKAGATSAVAQQFLGVDAPFVGRPHADRVLTNGAELSLTEWFVGPAGIEVEIGLIPRVDLTDLPADPHDLASLVDAVVCIELASTRFTDLVAPGAPSLIADNGVASVIVVGETIATEEAAIRQLDDAVVSLDVDGVERVAATGASALGHPLNVLHFVAGMAIDWGTPIAAGELVITGTCTGLTPPEPAMSAVGRCGDATVSATFVS